MKKMQFRVSNRFDHKIEMSLEPEGTIVEIRPEESVLIEISGNENSIIDLQINKENDFFYLSVWPEDGGYKVFPQ